MQIPIHNGARRDFDLQPTAVLLRAAKLRLLRRQRFHDDLFLPFQIQFLSRLVEAFDELGAFAFESNPSSIGRELPENPLCVRQARLTDGPHDGQAGDE